MVWLGGVELGWVWLGWVKNSLDDDSVGGSGALKKMSISNDTYWQSSASAKYMGPAPSSAGHCGTADWTVATRATRAKNIIRVLDTIFACCCCSESVRKEKRSESELGFDRPTASYLKEATVSNGWTASPGGSFKFTLKSGSVRMEASSFDYEN